MRVHNARALVWQTYLAHPERFAPYVSRPARPAVRPPLWRKARQFMRALAGGFVSKATREVRLTICDRCPQQTVKGKARFCGACGCPKWLPADLRFKARLRKAPCPLDKWPKEDVE